VAAEWLPPYSLTREQRWSSCVYPNGEGCNHDREYRKRNGVGRAQSRRSCLSDPEFAGDQE
jgi:hypothetical protein